MSINDMRSLLNKLNESQTRSAVYDSKDWLILSEADQDVLVTVEDIVRTGLVEYARDVANHKDYLTERAGNDLGYNKFDNEFTTKEVEKILKKLIELQGGGVDKSKKQSTMVKDAGATLTKMFNKAISVSKSKSDSDGVLTIAKQKMTKQFGILGDKIEGSKKYLKVIDELVSRYPKATIMASEVLVGISQMDYSAGTEVAMNALKSLVSFLQGSTINQSVAKNFNDPSVDEDEMTSELRQDNEGNPGMDEDDIARDIADDERFGTKSKKDPDIDFDEIEDEMRQDNEGNPGMDEDDIARDIADDERFGTKNRRKKRG